MSPIATPEAIAAINELPADELRVSDLVRLKSGHDSFSRLTLDALRRMVGLPAVEVVTRAIKLKGRQGSAFRWHLRGLTINRAIRKVQADQRITRNAIAARKS